MNPASSIRILEHPDFDISEFSERWRNARLSALKVSLRENGVSVSDPTEPVDQAREEHRLLSAVRDEFRSVVLRKVFDYSRQLGMSASRAFKLSFEIGDFSEILESIELPCFRGKWREHNGTRVLERTGCEAVSLSGGLACDYWREALDGLVMGAGSAERLARHRSRGHGDDECVDVLFEEEFSLPRVIGEGAAKPRPESKKFGPVPTEVADALGVAADRLKKMKIALHVDGVSEGVLYYRLDPEKGVLCGAGGKMIHESFQRELNAKFPNLKLQDASPLAVYGGST